MSWRLQALREASEEHRDDAHKISKTILFTKASKHLAASWDSTLPDPIPCPRDPVVDLHVDAEEGRPKG